MMVVKMVKQLGIPLKVNLFNNTDITITIGINRVICALHALQNIAKDMCTCGTLDKSMSDLERTVNVFYTKWAKIKSYISINITVPPKPIDIRWLSHMRAAQWLLLHLNTLINALYRLEKATKKPGIKLTGAINMIKDKSFLKNILILEGIIKKILLIYISRICFSFLFSSHEIN